MKRFTHLYRQLDQTMRTSDKTEALVDYFRAAPPRDAAWALYVLTGRRLIRGIAHTRLRKWAAEEAKLPAWLVDECYQAVGDLSETVALLLPERERPTDRPLHEIVEQWILPLGRMSEAEQAATMKGAWRELDREQRFVFHKLIAGTFRVGAAQKLVVNALAAAAGVEPAIMQHRVAGQWQPTAADFEALLSGDGGDEPGRPYPFFLASPLDEPAALVDEAGDAADVRDWQAEWKWDGIRAQLIRRRAQVMLWSRGDELITDTFPEVTVAARPLPDGTVLDGEIVAWEDDRPLPFIALQRRLNRKRVQPRLFAEVPVVFMAYDLLERGGRDVRSMPLEQRREQLEALIHAAHEHEDAAPLRLSPVLAASTWDALAAHHATAYDRGAEGVMLKRRGSPYRVGRTRGDWWKWKVDPFTVDCVMIYAEHGHGKRAGLFTDYTFAVWRDGELVPVTKAYSGLTADQIEQVDRFVREHTRERRGPLRIVELTQVFELAFEGIQRSDRHRSGIALRFPRMARWRTDKRADEADGLAHLERLLEQEERRAAPRGQGGAP